MDPDTNTGTTAGFPARTQDADVPDGTYSLVSDVFSFHSDGREDAKLGSNTVPMAPNRLLSDPSGSIDAQGECKRV